MLILRLFQLDPSLGCILIVADSVSEGGRLSWAHRLFLDMMDDAMRTYFVALDLFDGFLLVLSQAVLEAELEVGAIRGEN